MKTKLWLNSSKISPANCSKVQDHLVNCQLCPVVLHTFCVSFGHCSVFNFMLEISVITYNNSELVNKMPRATLPSETTISDMQMRCNIFPILSMHATNEMIIIWAFLGFEEQNAFFFNHI